MRLAAPPTPDSIVDGPGLRTTIWFQGCPHHCPGCHNPQTHDPAAGYTTTPQSLIAQIPPYQDGVTFSGGDPLIQPPSPLIQLADWAHERGMTVWCYTGYLFEEVQTHPLLPHIDVLVDGPFIESQKTYDLPFVGSKNQRIIDVPNSLKERRVVLWTNKS